MPSIGIKPRCIQFQRNKFQGFFKDKLQFFKDKDLLKNRLSLTPSWTPYWLKEVMESFLQPWLITLFYTTFQQQFANWLGVTCNCIWGTYWHLKKETEVRYCSCTKIFLEKVVKFKDFSRPNKEIKYFWRTSTEFKDFSRQLLKFKTF